VDQKFQLFLLTDKSITSD